MLKVNVCPKNLNANFDNYKIKILGKKYCYGDSEGEFCSCDFCKCQHGYGVKGYGNCVHKK